MIPLHGFVFFGSASLFYQKLKATMREQEAHPPVERLRIMVFDVSKLSGVDPTACNTLAKARRLILDEFHIELVWAGLDSSRGLDVMFEQLGLLRGAKTFSTTDVALKWVEDELLRRGRRLAELVISSNDTVEHIHYRAAMASVFSVAASSPDRISSVRMLPHSVRATYQEGEAIFDQAAAEESALFLLLLGEVELTERFGRSVEPRTLFAGSFFNHQRCVLQKKGPVNRGGGAPVAAYALTDVTVLKFTPADFA